MHCAKGKERLSNLLPNSLQSPRHWEARLCLKLWALTRTFLILGPSGQGWEGKEGDNPRGFPPYNSAPHLATFRLLRLPAASGTGLTGTRRSLPLHGWRPITRPIVYKSDKLLTVKGPRHFSRARGRSPPPPTRNTPSLVFTMEPWFPAFGG